MGALYGSPRFFAGGYRSRTSSRRYRKGDSFLQMAMVIVGPDSQGQPYASYAGASGTSREVFASRIDLISRKDSVTLWSDSHPQGLAQRNA